MKITVITVGKIKEKYLKEAIKEYVKRLSKYIKLKLIEVADEKAPESLSEKEEKHIMDIEGKRILNKIKKQQFAIVLDLKGKQKTSEEFSNQFAELQLDGNSDVVFIIGGSLGLSEYVLDRANDKMSFSKMTFPHQMMKLILLEQIYRAFRIIRNEPYHK